MRVIMPVIMTFCLFSWISIVYCLPTDLLPDSWISYRQLPAPDPPLSSLYALPALLH